MTTFLYLKQNAILEPLWWSWYAWSHLIYPITAAMHVANRHVPIMEKFVFNANTHLSIKNQKFQSGPIIQLGTEHIDSIKSLLNETIQKQNRLIRLAQNIRDVSLAAQASNGRTLEPLYKMLNEDTKGLIEFVYDINFSSGMRFIEPLIYQDLYSTEGQKISFSLCESDNRPFILGTPRLPTDSNLQATCSFVSPYLDDLFASQSQGIEETRLARIADFLGVNITKLKQFFTPKKPDLNDNNFLSEGIRVRYFGHACVLVQTAKINILIDPLISYRYPSDIPRYTFDDLPEQLDYVIVTHAHQDHFSIENLLKLRHKTRNIVVARNAKGNIADPSMRLVLKCLGFRSVIEVDEMDVIELPGGSITALPFLGEHAELDIQSKMTYVIRLAGQSILFAADTNNYDNTLFERVFARLPPVDVLFVGMECDGGPLNWLYGPLITRNHDIESTRTRTLSGSNYPKAFALAKVCGCHSAYVYSMGQEPWLNYIMNINYTAESLQITESNQFLAACNAQGILAKRLFGKAEWIYVPNRYDSANFKEQPYTSVTVGEIE